MRKTILPFRACAIATIRIAFITCLSCFTFFHSKAQCFASSTVSGTTAVNDASIGTLSFNDETYSLASDDNRAYATALVALFNGSSNYLKVTGFGFSIPSYASICGISVEIEKRATGIIIGAWIRDNDIRVVKANAVAGVDGGDHVTDWSGTESVSTYGGTNDLWGTTLTPAEVNSPNFGIAISARFRGLVGVFPSARVDNIRVTVYYNPILPVKIVSFNSSIKKNIARLDWETVDESDHETITLQRTQAGAAGWTDIAHYALQNSNQRKKYSYTDPLDKTGFYQYRLKISGVDHQLTYSAIKMVEWLAGGEPLLYPNPARDLLTVQNLDDSRNIIVTNLAQQQLRIPIQITGEHGARIDVSMLPQGIYFICAGSKKMKFFKE